jgi:hypothetical protein
MNPTRDESETPPDEPPEAVVEARADDLLPEERAVGSDDPEAQAAAILEESEARILDPETEEQRTSEETVDPTP